jgi:hypothetical protein
VKATGGALADERAPAVPGWELFQIRMAATAATAPSKA